MAGYGDLDPAGVLARGTAETPPRRSRRRTGFIPVLHARTDRFHLYAALVLLPTDTAPHFITLFERQLQALFTPTRPSRTTDRQGPLRFVLNLQPAVETAELLLHAKNHLPLRRPPAPHQPGRSARCQQNGSHPKAASGARGQHARIRVTSRLADDSFAHDTARSPTAAVWGGIRYDMDSTAFAAVNPFDPAAEPLAEFQRKDGSPAT